MKTGFSSCLIAREFGLSCVTITLHNHCMVMPMVDDPAPDESVPAPSPAPPPRAVQLSLALPAPAAGVDDVLVPARMINEWVYCPRLAYLEWVEGEWADSGDTEEGRRVHARVDAARPSLPPPEAVTEDSAPFTTRSVELSSDPPRPCMR